MVIVLFSVSSSGALLPTLSPRTSASFIVPAQSMAAAGGAAVEVGGVVTQALPIINRVVATLPLDAVARLQRDPALSLYPNAIVRTTSDRYTAEQTPPPAPNGKETMTSGYLLYPSAATGAQLLHSQTISTRKTECKNQRVTVAAGQENRSL